MLRTFFSPASSHYTKAFVQRAAPYAIQALNFAAQTAILANATAHVANNSNSNTTNENRIVDEEQPYQTRGMSY